MGVRSSVTTSSCLPWRRSIIRLFKHTFVIHHSSFCLIRFHLCPSVANFSSLTLPVPKGFSLPHAVCSYGYFLLPPNRWDRNTETLHRPLRLSDGSVVRMTVTQKNLRSPILNLKSNTPVPRSEHTRLKQQAARMFRLGEDFRPWHRMHPEARRHRFDRLFRSPTIFEDIIKTITGQNVTWRNTIMMNRLMVDHVGGGGFPTPGQLAAMGADQLKVVTKVGYRADRIIRLARGVVEGTLDLSWFEAPGRTSDELYDALLSIHGLGPYAAANLLMLLGHYDRVAIDTETYRHHCLRMGIDRPRNPKALHDAIDAEYHRHAPYDFLAYWYELWEGYQTRFGPATRWDAATDGPNFTAANLREPKGRGD